MKSASISQLKARLSEYLDSVRKGDEVLVTDRGRPVARLAPAHAPHQLDARLDELVRSGRMRPPTGKLPADFYTAKLPRDKSGKSLAAVLEERSQGW